MIARLWRTGVDEERMEEYRRFEQRRSEPMFRALEGCLGVLCLRTGTGPAALSLWRDRAAVARLVTNRRYQRNVRSLAQTGGDSIEWSLGCPISDMDTGFRLRHTRCCG